MRARTIAAAGVACLLISATAFAAGQRPLVVTATGSARYLPGQSLVLTVTTGKQTTAAKALDQNNKVVQQIQQGLTSLGISKPAQVSFKTPSQHVDRQWQNGSYVTQGYRASQTIEISLPGSKTELAGQVSNLASLVCPANTAISSSQGWNSRNNSKHASAQRRAESAACKALLKEAQRQASALGVKIDPVPLAIGTPAPTYGGSRGYDFALESAPARSMSAAATPTQVSRPGWVTVDAQKQGTFNITGLIGN